MNASGGLSVRADFGPRPVSPNGMPSPNPRGYKVTMANFANLKTGSLFYQGNDGNRVDLRVPKSKVNPDEWFTLDVIVRATHIVTLVNGEMAVDHIDPNDTYQRGHLALLAYDPKAVVQFRKIEIKEMPPEAKPPAPLAVAPFTDADVQRIASLPAALQVEEVRKELIRRNPRFDGKMEHEIEDGVVTKFKIVTDQVTDIAPIRVFSALRWLACAGTDTNLKANGQLEDLTPLKGMNLETLTRLWLSNTKVGDAGLAIFKDCENLQELQLWNTRVTDAGLAHFVVNLKGIPLKTLWIDNTAITDVTPLQAMPLEHISLTPKNITRGLDILRDMTSLKTIGLRWIQRWPAAEFWKRYDKGEFK